MLWKSTSGSIHCGPNTHIGHAHIRCFANLDTGGIDAVRRCQHMGRHGQVDRGNADGAAQPFTVFHGMGQAVGMAQKFRGPFHVAFSQQRADIGRSIAEEYEASSPLGDRETLIADSRYRFIEAVVQTSVKKVRQKGEKTWTDRIDAVVTHKFWAFPVFLAMLAVMFWFTFGPIGSGLSDRSPRRRH